MSEPKSKLSRRTLFAGAGTVGAVAATAALLPRVAQQSESEVVSQARPAPEKGGGYQLTEHVKRYYKSTLL